jgi:hydrogenase maturation protease
MSIMEEINQFPVLLLGYGNLDREDDGVAWHVLSRLARRLGRQFPDKPEDFEFLPGEQIDFYFSLQLVPELAETISQYARVCFIDAHTGAVPEEIHQETISPQMQTSSFTHHLTAAMLLNLANTLYMKAPDATLISVRGYSFEFSQQLSPKTDQLADQAVKLILAWLEKS